jgi:hypothetical protein
MEKRFIHVTLAALFLSCVLVIEATGQSPVHPWWVVDAGGGRLIGGSLTLTASIGQPAVEVMTATGFTLEDGYIPGIRFLGGASAILTMRVDTSWNMIAVPLIVPDFAKTTLFPTSISPAYCFVNGYVAEDTLTNGCGYWLKFDTAQTISLGGTTIVYDTIDVRAGWNIIGAISYPLLITDIVPVPPLTIQSSYYGYKRGAGYYTEDTLRPGVAYWLKVSQAGKLVLPSGSVLDEKGDPTREAVSITESADDVMEGNVLFIKDARGDVRLLQFGPPQTGVDLSQRELPPPPPAGILDVRFGSQRAVEAYDPASQERQVFPVLITEALYPMELRWEMSDDGTESALEILRTSGERTVQPLTGTGSLILEKPGVVEVLLRVSCSTGRLLPIAFALHHSYPNPFNPLTTIRYDLPVPGRVVLDVYNILGQKVRTLVDEIQDAGFKSVQWDAGNLASGVYFYRLETSDFVRTRKVVLLR